MTIKNYYKGMPCMLGEVVGKLVGESNEGSWGIINGVDMFSIPLFSTPHGTVIKTGVLKLSDITEDGMNRIIELEKQAIEDGVELYAGYLK